VKGGKELAKIAEAGMALFAAQKEDEIEFDVDGAKAFKADVDAKIKALEDAAAALTGKDNAKARKEKSKEASEMKRTPQYIDAEKVIKGLQPKNGNFAKVKAAAKAEPAPAPTPAPAEEEAKEEPSAKEKKEKPKKAQESAGISKAERDELEKLKTDIIARKKELKEQGMSGGQQNKDEQVVAMVTRMNELKEKENPGCLSAAKEEKKGGSKKKLSAEQEADKAKLEQEIEEYKAKLKAEFGYSAKDMKADPDLTEMTARLAAMGK